MEIKEHEVGCFNISGISSSVEPHHFLRLEVAEKHSGHPIVTVDFPYEALGHIISTKLVPDNLLEKMRCQVFTSPHHGFKREHREINVKLPGRGPYREGTADYEEVLKVLEARAKSLGDGWEFSTYGLSNFRNVQCVLRKENATTTTMSVTFFRWVKPGKLK